MKANVTLLKTNFSKTINDIKISGKIIRVTDLNLSNNIELII